MTTVKDDIATKLSGDSTYLTLLGSPTAVPYKTYYLRPPVVPEFPIVVYYIYPTIYDNKYERSILSSDSDLVFNVWAEANTHESIALRIAQLLHQTSFSNGFRTILDGNPIELFDNDFNMTGKTVKFNMKYRRALI